MSLLEELLHKSGVHAPVRPDSISIPIDSSFSAGLTKPTNHPHAMRGFGSSLPPPSSLPIRLPQEHSNEPLLSHEPSTGQNGNSANVTDNHPALHDTLTDSGSAGTKSSVISPPYNRGSDGSSDYVPRSAPGSGYISGTSSVMNSAVTSPTFPALHVPAQGEPTGASIKGKNTIGGGTKDNSRRKTLFAGSTLNSKK